MKIPPVSKVLFPFLLFAFCIHTGYAQTNQWVWIKGDSSGNSDGFYGTQGLSSQLNKPAARAQSMSWTDAANNFWLYGGAQYSSGPYRQYSDLWKYDVAANAWNWIKGDSTINNKSVYGTKGVAAAANNPGGRAGSICWTDASGNLWLYGGSGFINAGSFGYKNDLWRYNITTNNWTWVKGDSGIINSGGVYGVKDIPSTNNNPSSKFRSVSWADNSGNLWLFGGFGISGGSLTYQNDVWRYNISANQWTWIKGDSSASPGIYGTRGISSPVNNPGSRFNSISWTDASSNVWLFGGSGYGRNSVGYLNDLWRYNTSSNEWTWIKGDDSASAPGVYGIKGIAADTVKPGGRTGSISMTDRSGNFRLFGGNGNAENGIGNLNDLWEYNISANTWRWLSGDSTVNSTGIYGMQGIQTATNKPGARTETGAGWTDASGNTWLFGGLGNAGFLNDLWKYSLNNAALPVSLLSFKGTLQNETSKLEWTVEYETDFDRYEMERSVNGTDFYKIGEIKATNSRHYSYNDKVDENMGRRFYYRLKKVNKDNNFSYSYVVALQIPFQPGFTTYPNPARTHFDIQPGKNITGKITIEIADLTGKVLLKKDMNSNGSPITISTSELSAGTYVVKLIHQDKQYLRQLIVIKK